MQKKILLISPASDNEALWVTGNEGPEVMNNMVPLALATVAGMTPVKIRVDIWDELVHGLINENTIFETEYDLVGITGYKAHLPRCRELAAIFRERSIPTAIGGSGVSGTPDEYRKDFDILFIGEAEKIWPQFLHEWDQGSFRSEYRQIEKIDLAESPLPKWDSIARDMSKYAMGCVQTSRGCPFDCDFCDVIYLFGRRPRHKTLENILEEVKTLEGFGMRSIFFNDDEFIGDRRFAKELLRALIPLNNSFTKPLTFSTQLTIDVSKDKELLELLAESNFELVFIGIETPNKESLKETNKLQNLSGDLIEQVHNILSYGIAIRAGMIVGFDHDDKDIFAIHYDFIQRSFIPSVAINMLKAPFGTKLWAKLRQDGRVVYITPEVRNTLGHPRSYTTIIPKGMSRVELMKGYRNLIERVSTWESFAERIRGFVSIVRQHTRTLKRPQTVVASDLASTIDVDGEGKKSIDKIITWTEQKAPHMIGRIKALIGQHAKYRESIGKLLPQIKRQIELESSGKLVFHIDRRPIPVPIPFKKAYKTLFPDVYRRIYLNLKDKDQVPAALVEVFVDFLSRSGESFSRLEAHHRPFLKEICDRTCAKLNGQPPDEFEATVNRDAQVPDARRSRLADDILKNVEQILFGVTEAGSRNEDPQKDDMERRRLIKVGV